MSKTTLPLISVTIRRDASTITPVTVLPHELAILANLFGKENVQGGDAAYTIEIDADGEYERLVAKYGAAKIASVYGDDGGQRLAETIARTAAQPLPDVPPLLAPAKPVAAADPAPATTPVGMQPDDVQQLIQKALAAQAKTFQDQMAAQAQQFQQQLQQAQVQQTPPASTDPATTGAAAGGGKKNNG